MTISNVDRDKIVRLAQEGKQISKIVDEDFRDLDYWEVYWVAIQGGQPSGQGVKKKISNRLKALASANKKERDELIVEIADLVSHLYTNYRINSQKLDKIRKALEN